MKEYHLHRNDFTKLQLDIHDAKPYCERNSAHCYRSHRHSYHQLIWFTSAGQHYVDFKEYQHAENTIFLLMPGQVHRFCSDAENEGFLFHFNDIFLHRNDKDAAMWAQYELFNELAEPCLQLPSGMEAEFHYITSQLREEITNKEYNYREQLYSYLKLLLLKVERLKRGQSQTPTRDAHFRLAMRFKQAVDEHKYSFQNVQFFADLLAVGEKTLGQASKKYFRTTPANFIHQKRILEAKRLLVSADLSIKEVAYKLGFQQATYFTKYFKKQTELTPRAFQQQLS